MKITSLAVALAAACLPSAAFCGVLVGSPATGANVFPFGHSYSGEYQQVYDSSAFSGPITITGLDFYNTLYDYGTASTPTGTWNISLSTTSVAPGSISSIPGNNVGANNTPVFSGNLYQTWAFGDTLHIAFSTPFTYNPLNGNLLMDVNADTLTTTGLIGFDASYVSSMGRLFAFYGNSANGYGVDGQGLVTYFDTVPEPGTYMAVMGALALGAAAFGRRCKRS